MREVLKVGGFILIAGGTLGLIINDLVFNWGRVATLTFAVFNLLGLAILISAFWSRKRNTSYLKSR